MKKAVALLLCAIMIFALTACGQSTEQSNEKDSYTIGICQLVQHPALDAATQGFKEAVTKALGDKVTFDEKNASNDIPACATIANGFVSANVDLIMANATPALQAAAAATTEIPILGTSVTEYGVALDIKDFDGTVGGNVSGTSDLAPLAEQAAMITELVPAAKKVALIYCSAEANSLYQVTVVKAELE
ncbi:MAG: ABC transporter substrate binding protein, partial [Clostridia bacterium]|nr:ABC transporter substrate binding protein [Clostridia bacterium]